jgi:hypothetical protein
VLKCCDQDLTLHHLIEIWNQKAVEEAEEPQPESDCFEFDCGA